MDFRPDYVIIPYELIQNKNLHPLDRILYGVIYYFERMKEGKCIASNTTLAEYCNAERTSINSSLTRLENERYIIRLYKDKQKKIRDEIKTLIQFRQDSLFKVKLNNYTVKSDNYTPSSQITTGVKSNNYHINKNILIKDYKYNKEDEKLTELLYSLVKQNYPFLFEKGKKSLEKKFKKDCTEMNKLHRIDNRDYKKIAFIILWSQKDSFWKQNIRSVQKLRKQFDSLMVKAQAEYEKSAVVKI